MSDALSLLKERGFVSQCSNEEGLRRLFERGPVTFYIGFDPTARSLSAGNLLQLMFMAHLQRLGHRPIALVGGGTSRIGDPSGKTEERKILSPETILANSEAFRRQIGKLLDFGPGKALMLDNSEWLAPLHYIEFLRDIGVHFSVNRMLSFETYKTRLETGLSFIEFNYQVLQSYDFLVLYRRHGCMLQMGGDDQWGNIVSGMDLIRRVEGAEVFALTSPLITRSDGKKMGKSEKGAVYLDPELVSPYEFFQYWRNVPDPDVGRFLLLFTFLPSGEARRLGALRDREINLAKEILAHELTTLVHGREEADKAREASHAAFDARGSAEAGLGGIPAVELGRAEVEGMTVTELFVRAALCASKAEARRLIQQGGAFVNDENVADVEAKVERGWIRDGEIVLRAGKKRYSRAVVR